MHKQNFFAKYKGVELYGIDHPEQRGRILWKRKTWDDRNGVSRIQVMAIFAGCICTAIIGPRTREIKINRLTLRRLNDMKLVQKHELVANFDWAGVADPDPLLLAVTKQLAEGARSFWGQTQSAKHLAAPTDRSELLPVLYHLPWSSDRNPTVTQSLTWWLLTELLPAIVKRYDGSTGQAFVLLSYAESIIKRAVDIDGSAETFINKILAEIAGIKLKHLHTAQVLLLKNTIDYLHIILPECTERDMTDVLLARKFMNLLVDWSECDYSMMSRVRPSLMKALQPEKR